PVYSIRPEGVCSCRQGSECSSPGKHPITANGFKNATTNEATIRQWWEDSPHANVAIATGKCIPATGNCLIVLDVDPRNCGDESLDILLRSGGPPPKTPAVSTGGGGKHLYLMCAEEQVRSRILAPGLELKADGACVVAPPSDHASGQQYEWEVALDVGFAPA